MVEMPFGGGSVPAAAAAATTPASYWKYDTLASRKYEYRTAVPLKEGGSQDGSVNLQKKNGNKRFNFHSCSSSFQGWNGEKKTTHDI